MRMGSGRGKKLGEPGGRTPVGSTWNPTPKMGSGTNRTVNGTRTPVRGGNGATRSKEWYARYD